MRAAFLKKKPRDLPANTIQDLNDLTDTLGRISEKIEEFETDRSNSLALAKIGAVVNSSLELKEGLRIVMHNIVHLTHAERGFLMLRNEKDEIVTEEAHLDFGLGTHYGEAVLGLIGTEKRLEYTTIGDSINTAKRIQENSAKNQILLSPEAYERVKKQADAKPFTPLTVKGRAQPLVVYELLGLK